MIFNIGHNALTACNISIMDGDFDKVTDELVYVGPKSNKVKCRFSLKIEAEKGNMLLVRS